jgi:hypothetical protein
MSHISACIESCWVLVLQPVHDRIPRSTRCLPTSPKAASNPFCSPTPAVRGGGHQHLQEVSFSPLCFAFCPLLLAFHLAAIEDTDPSDMPPAPTSHSSSSERREHTPLRRIHQNKRSRTGQCPTPHPVSRLRLTLSLSLIECRLPHLPNQKGEARSQLAPNPHSDEHLALYRSNVTSGRALASTASGSFSPANGHWPETSWTEESQQGKCSRTGGRAGRCPKVLQRHLATPVSRRLSFVALLPLNRPVPSERRTKPGACVPCKIARCKCSQDVPSCARCLEHKVTCEYGTKPGVPLVSIDVTPSSIGASPEHPGVNSGVERPGVASPALHRINM